MDEDELFYDSLEEDSNMFQSSGSKYNCEDNIEYKTATSELCSGISAQNNKIKKTKIPLYVGEINKEDIKLLLRSKGKKEPCNNHELSKSCLACLNCKKNHVKATTMQKLSPRKSSLENVNINSEQNSNHLNKDSADSICSIYNGFTSRSCVSSNACSLSSCSETKLHRAYRSFIPRKIDQHGRRKNVSRMFDDNSSIFTKFSSSSIDIENLKSVSEIYVPKIQKTVQVKYNPYLLLSPPLGSLGPDIEGCRIKMERLRKQQEYGIQASVHNRAKIIQSYMKTKQIIKKTKNNENVK